MPSYKLEAFFYQRTPELEDQIEAAVRDLLYREFGVMSPSIVAFQVRVVSDD